MHIHPPVTSSSSWFVALVRSGKELQAQEHLLSSGFDEAFHPRRRSTTTSRGKTHELLLPVFHGYVLVRTFAFTPFLWHYTVRNEDHPAWGLVRGFIGGWPADPVPDWSITNLKSCCDNQDIWLPDAEPETVLFTPGTLVRVLDDAFGDHLFSVVWDEGKGVRIKAVHGPGFALYVSRRECVVPVDAGPVQAGHAAKEEQHRGPTRGKRRLFRRARSAAA